MPGKKMPDSGAGRELYNIEYCGGIQYVIIFNNAVRMDIM